MIKSFEKYITESVGNLSVQYFGGDNEYYRISWTSLLSFNDLNVTFCVEIIEEVSKASISNNCLMDWRNMIFRNINYLSQYEVVVTPVSVSGNGTSSSKYFPGKNCLLL